MPSNKDLKNKKQLDDYAKYSSMAFQMAAIIGGGIFGGHYIDSLLHWGFPLFTILLAIISVFGAIYFMIKDLLKK